MTVEFALFLSPEGIALAHRQTMGHWALVAEAKPEGDDIGPAMTALKAEAARRGGAEAPVILVLPDDQVLYTSFMAPTGDADLVIARIAEGLDGLTPYAVAELVHDWQAVEEDRVKVAVVARETLDEATEFAASHGFQAAGFAAMPPAERFPAMPVFGDNAAALGLDRGGMAFGADDWSAAETARETARAATAIPDPTPETADAPEPPVTAEPEEEVGATPLAEPPAAAEGTVPAEDPAFAAAAVGDAPQAAEVGDAPEAAAPDAEQAAPWPMEADPAVDDPAQDPGAGDAVPEAAFEMAPQPISDPTLDQPIAPLIDEPTVAAASGSLFPDPAGAREAPSRPDDAVSTAGGTPRASRGKIEGPAQRPLTAERSHDLPPRPGTGPTLSADPGPGSLAADDADGATGPVLGFAARRGKVPRPEAAEGDIVSTRPSRLGFGARTEAEPASVLHPDAVPAPVPRSAPARPGHRLAAQLARVRDASKLAPQAAAGAKSAPRSATVRDEHARADEGSDLAARETAPAEDSRFGFTRSRPGEGSVTPAAPATGTNAFSSGLLARKPAETAGPSFKTGLILTLVLLVLLALIAIWSALFLPDSPIARLFGGGERDRAAATADAPAPPAPPLAVTAPPAMGVLDTGGAGPEAAPGILAGSEPAPTTDAPPPAESAEAGVNQPAADPATVASAPPAPVLPDIDADLDLPPLPPLAENLLPSPEETERIYAEDGIWPRPPERPTLSALSTSTEIYLASIDPEVPVTDALALADPALDFGEVLRRVPPPPPFGAVPDRDARGLVTPTPEGVLTPEGAFVVLGRPAVEAIPRPREIAPVAEPDAPAVTLEDAILGTFQPAPRPADLDETRERQVLGGFSNSELAALRPAERPVSAQEAAAQASLFPRQGAEAVPATPQPTDAVAETAAEAPAIAGTALAIASSRLPAARPGNIEALVAAAQEAAPAVAEEAVARAPSIPSNADVTRAATESNAIRLRDVNLIGVTGTPNDRRALVRLPSGRFVRVGVGDRLDGGRVAAIGETSLQYVRNGRNVTLEIPG